MTTTQRLLAAGFTLVTRLICRIDAVQLAKVPPRGPLILATNHVNILEIPILYTQLMPRPLTGLVSAHRWEVGWSRWLMQVFGAIPLRRGQADLGALRAALVALQRGCIVAVAPEGTRSGDGVLREGHAGIAALSVHSGAPLLPVVFYGAEAYKRNLRRLKRTDFHIAVGEPFYLDARGERLTRQVRREMADEVMRQLAALLPAAYRGAYANLEAAPGRHIRFGNIE